MIWVTDHLAIEENELQYEAVRSGGPGGQNVNKVASAIQLRFDVRASSSLPEPVRLRLEALAGSRLTDEGVLLLRAERFRTQEQNRADALERLLALLRAAAAPPPPPRRKTRPTRASQEKRLAGKRRRGEVKALRRVKDEGE